MYTTAKMMIAARKIPVALLPKPVPLTYIGENKVLKMPEIVSSFGLRKVLVITDHSLMSLGLLEPMLGALKTNNIQVSIFDEVLPDPTYDMVNRGLELCKSEECEGVIAFGGGSVLDSAKAIAMAYANRCAPEKLEGLVKAKTMRIPLIAVPTTAGTGSETTIVAVISDPATHRKTTIIDGRCVPDVAVLDPVITAGLPPHITAATAMDALTHALESYISTYATIKTKRLAEEAVRMIYKNVCKVYENPSDLKAREELLVASFQAGVAFSQTYVGYVHAFAHNYGGKFGIPHGLANAVLLPHIMEFSRPACEDEFAQLAKVLELSGNSNKELADAFLKSLWELNEKLNIPKQLEKFPRSAVGEICKAGFKECHGTYPVPRYLKKSEAIEILNKISVP